MGVLYKEEQHKGQRQEGGDKRDKGRDPNSVQDKDAC